MARFLGFITALAATGAFALTPESVNVNHFVRDTNLTL
jgi:hypothetical protein